VARPISGLLVRVTDFHLRDRIFRLKAEATRGGPSRSALRGDAAAFGEAAIPAKLAFKSW
jgi:hypothetical protein